MDDLNPHCIVHQLPEYARQGYPPSYEHPLPAKIEPSSLATLHPWLREVAALGPADAHLRLEATWNGIQDSDLRRVCDQILECNTKSLVLTGPNAWLLCVHANGGFYLVAPPMDRQAFQAQQAQCGLADHRLLTDLIENFGGLREDFAPGGGYFMVPREWRTVNEAWMEEVPGYSDWKDSLMLFSSRGGDTLLLHPSGRVGWWVAEGIWMRDAYPDLGTALVDFARYHEVPWPFNPHEPPSDYAWEVTFQ